MPSRRRILALAVLFAAILAPAAQSEHPADVHLLSLKSEAPKLVTLQLHHILISDLLHLRQFFFPERSLDDLSGKGETRVIVFGTLADYQQALASEGIKIANSACYVRSKGEIWLGYDGARFDAALDAAHAAQSGAKRRIEELQRSFAARQKQDEARYESDKVPTEQRKKLQSQARREFQKTVASLQREWDAANSLNGDLMAEATNRLRSAARHELFHHFVDSELCRARAGDLPTWFNEGAAQVFEHAPLFAVRPSDQAPELARSWREVGLNAQNPPSLRELLATDAKEFLVHNPEAKAEARRNYVLAWSVAQLLNTQKKLGDRAALERYMADVKTEPVARFEKYVGRPLAEFEAEWRKYVRPFGP